MYIDNSQAAPCCHVGLYFSFCFVKQAWQNGATWVGPNLNPHAPTKPKVNILMTITLPGDFFFLAIDIGGMRALLTSEYLGAT